MRPAVAMALEAVGCALVVELVMGDGLIEHAARALRERARRRRAPDGWSLDGEVYDCQCGYAFKRDGARWVRRTERGEPWRVVGVGMWEDIEELDGDCAGYLLRHYAAPRPRRWPSGRFPRLTLTCGCDGLSPHLHYRRRKWFG